MRWFSILLLLLLPCSGYASENLIENMHTNVNITITDGVIRQIKGDPRESVQWKMQLWFDNTNHNNSNVIAVVWKENDSLGFQTATFTTPSNLDGLLYFRFGLDGAEKDTTVMFDIKDVQPSTTYTIQWRVLNNIQGEFAWTDMRVVHCGDGYSLALGDEDCSRECENETADGGYVPSNEAKVYEPAVCTYNQSNLICDDGYTKIDNACEQICTTVHIGNTANRLYTRKLSSPVLGVDYKGRVCYGRFATGHGTGLNVDFNGAVYHLID